MAETLGSLCDKLTVVELKLWHTDDSDNRQSLQCQQRQLTDEIDEYVSDALSGQIQPDRLTFDANKVSKGVSAAPVDSSMGEVVSELARVNCALWHEQEKVYEFERVPPLEKDLVVKSLAILNLQRNKCIDAINREFKEVVIGGAKE